MKTETEWVPWYRRKSYKGDLSEEEKRILDSFRLQEKHPATDYQDLPEDVKRYINRIEFELYRKKQEGAAGMALLLTAVAALLIYFAYTGRGDYPIYSYASGIVILILAWYGYRREWKKNADELFPKGKGAPLTDTDVGIQEEWELVYIVNYKKQKRAGK
jgi:hypothetical protein